jgi:hypothetical protein
MFIIFGGGMQEKNEALDKLAKFSRLMEWVMDTPTIVGNKEKDPSFEQLDILQALDLNQTEKESLGPDLSNKVDQLMASARNLLSLRQIMVDSQSGQGTKLTIISEDFRTNYQSFFTKGFGDVCKAVAKISEEKHSAPVEQNTQELMNEFASLFASAVKAHYREANLVEADLINMQAIHLILMQSSLPKQNKEMITNIVSQLGNYRDRLISTGMFHGSSHFYQVKDLTQLHDELLKTGIVTTPWEQMKDDISSISEHTKNTKQGTQTAINGRMDDFKRVLDDCQMWQASSEKTDGEEQLAVIIAKSTRAQDGNSTKYLADLTKIQKIRIELEKQYPRLKASFDLHTMELSEAIKANLHFFNTDAGQKELGAFLYKSFTDGKTIDFESCDKALNEKQQASGVSTENVFKVLGEFKARQEKKDSRPDSNRFFQPAEPEIGGIPHGPKQAGMGYKK